uniref:Ribosomal protein L30 ferredoxin-like fold domain-containing protein n=1 Tax=Rhodosorus marinus TaxID=101924 RepID=A0A7S2ZPD2_9RHOD|mmetsp:Transcript_25164/g.99235  ORF Transcript_25164/g.99235 Transcript_25164/m.99235 type:complete len:190 (+) Transcript_25164:398-967(+)
MFFDDWGSRFLFRCRVFSAPRVPETVLKRKRAASFAAALNSKRKRSNKTKSKLETSVKRAEKFVMEFRNKERSTRRAKSVIRGKRADSSKRITIAPEDKVLLVIRIRAGKKDEIPNIYAKTLKKFSLNKLFSGRLIRHNKDNLKKLKTVCGSRVTSTEDSTLDCLVLKSIRRIFFNSDRGIRDLGQPKP